MLVLLLAQLLLPTLLNCFAIIKPRRSSLRSIECNYQRCDVNITPVTHLDELIDAALMITYERHNIDANRLFGQSPLLVPFTPSALDEMRSSFTKLYQLELDRLTTVYKYIHRKDSMLRNNDHIINKRQIYVAKLNSDISDKGASSEKIDHRIVGYIDIDNTFDSVVLHGNPIPYVSDFIVAQSYRNRGIGAQLLAHAENVCSSSYYVKPSSPTANRFSSSGRSSSDNCGSEISSDIFKCLGLHLSVETSNTHALRFYMNFGFLPLFMEKLQVISSGSTSSSSGDVCTVIRSPFTVQEIQTIANSTSLSPSSNDSREALVRLLESFPTFQQKSVQGYDRMLLKKVFVSPPLPR